MSTSTDQVMQQRRCTRPVCIIVDNCLAWKERPSVRAARPAGPVLLINSTLLLLRNAAWQQYMCCRVQWHAKSDCYGTDRQLHIISRVATSQLQVINSMSVDAGMMLCICRNLICMLWRPSSIAMLSTH